MLVPKWSPIAVKTRGDMVETVHYGGVIEVDSDDKVLFELDESGAQSTFFRSCFKFFQAYPLIECGAADAFHLTDEEIAVCCSSHDGEERHVQLVRSILKKGNLHEDDLQCGAHAPYCQPCMSRDDIRSIHNNCSGKHAAMLLCCQHLKLDHHNYLLPQHPLHTLQMNMFCKLVQMQPSSLPPPGVDGCGLPTYSLPLRTIALSFSRASLSPHFQRLFRCAQLHPHAIGGENVYDTQLMTILPNVVCKRGGAALLCALNTKLNKTLVVKCADGSMDVAAATLTYYLQKLNWATPQQLEPLQQKWGNAPVKNVVGKIVGSIVVLK